MLLLYIHTTITLIVTLPEKINKISRSPDSFWFKIYIYNLAQVSFNQQIFIKKNFFEGFFCQIHRMKLIWFDICNHKFIVNSHSIIFSDFKKSFPYDIEGIYLFYNYH